VVPVGRHGGWARIIKEIGMDVRTGRAVVVCVATILLGGCAGLSATVTEPVKAPLRGERVLVFPFPDPYYGARQIPGVGLPFTTVFIGKLQAAGVTAEAPKTQAPTNPNDVVSACRYAREESYGTFLTGTITEWIDGATQWSGRVDVAALTVNVYRTDTCALAGSASGHQNGQWFTFINSPTTRFFEPLSDSIVATLLTGAAGRQ
jgi:hypothetical protein